VGRATGIGVYTRSLLLELARAGDAEWLGLAHREVEFAGELEAAGVRLEYEPAPLGVIWQQLLLPKRLARGDVDLFWSPLLTLPRRLPVPGVVTLHDLATVLYPETQNLKVKWSLRPFLDSTVERAARVIAISAAVGAEIERHYPAARGKIEIVANGVDPEFRPADAAGILATRERLGLSGGYVLYAGTIEPRKNLELLLDAWRGARAAQPSFPPLVLAGPPGWKSGGLERRLAGREGEGVVRLGSLPRAELVAVLQAATVFVFPSLYEGFGLPAAEALACGVPTIVSRTPSLVEVVGDAAAIVDPDDPEDLAAVLLDLVANPDLAQRLAAAGPPRAELFRWNRAARRLRAIFAEVLAEAGWAR
jgi:alpha-1,3-rhamnosyl/mannosyltransferase